MSTGTRSGDAAPHTQFEEAADCAPAPVWMTNAAGEVVFANQSFQEYAGLSREALMGHVWLTLLHPDDLPHVRDIRAAAWEAGHQPYTFEARFRRGDGQWRWLEVSSKPRRDAHNGFHGYVGLAVDRTDAKHAEEQMRASEERYRALVESQADMLCRFRADGTILFANASYAATTGKTADELIGANFWNIVTAEDRAAVRAMLDGLCAEAPEVRIENRITTKDGVRWTMWTNRATQFDADGKWSEAQSTGMDITDRKRAEQHRDLLIDELNHRVKNTLAIVQGLAQQTFKHNGANDAGYVAFHSRLRALAAAHDLLSRERWEAADLAALARETLDACGATHERTRLSGPTTMLAPKQAVSFAMALHELATNALKYGALSNAQGTLELSWSIEEAPTVLTLIWRERGGPNVAKPERRGFGVHLIERALAHELNGSATIEFAPDGVLCTIRAPLGD